MKGRGDNDQNKLRQNPAHPGGHSIPKNYEIFLEIPIEIK